MDDAVRVAAAQYPIEFLPSFAAWETKIFNWVEEAALANAQLLVFPEYAAMELAGTSLQIAEDLHQSLEAVSRSAAGSIRRTTVFRPDGSDHQDKIVMKRFEREIWGITGVAACRHQSGTRREVMNHRASVGLCLLADQHLLNSASRVRAVVFRRSCSTGRRCCRRIFGLREKSLEMRSLLILQCRASGL